MTRYPKHDTLISINSSRSRKRSFHGNQHTNSDSKKWGGKKLSNTMSENVTVSYRIIEFVTVVTASLEIIIC